ncbi:MAG TPA: anti-sigma factor [Caulobacteraceae bacterium]|jgi:anti-sigma factor RsiW
MSACPDKELMLHALVDGELDAGHALEVEAHAATCAGCAAELAAIRQVKAALTAQPLGYRAPASLLARLDAALEAETAPPAPPRRRRPSMEGWVLSGVGGALAASLALFALAPQGASLESQLVDAQARSLQAAHLVDIPTSDRHVVKPWFDGKIDFAPPVVDLIAQGYPLVGGRLDHIDGRQVAALVFHRQAHVINLFIWPGSAPEGQTLEHRDGYSLVRWSQGGLVFWAVSDCDPQALTTFARAYAAAIS